MSATDQAILEKVQQWLHYGDEDLCLAKHGFTLKSAVPYRLLAYHAQQCAEKHLKAYLVFARTDFPFTHNIGHLVELCQTTGNWPESLLDAEELTPYAITTRYPGTDEPVTASEAQNAIAIAEQTRQLVRQALDKAGITPHTSHPLHT